MEKLCEILIAIGQIGLENSSVKEIDINLLFCQGLTLLPWMPWWF
jgi:hypothetical protein